MCAPSDAKEPSELVMECCPQSKLYELYCRVSSICPQDASGDPPLFPRSSQLCNGCSIICTMAAIYVHFFYDYADTRGNVLEEDPSLVWYFTFTGTLAFGGLVYEASLAISIYLVGMSQRFQEDVILRRRLRLNRKMIFVLANVAACYFLMARNFHVVHRSWIADYYGGDQIIYSIRYAEWVVSASMVMSINGQMDHTAQGVPRNGLTPSSVLTGIYCIIGLQGLLVKDFYVAWSLIFFSFVCYGAASAQQLMFAHFIKDRGDSGRLRACLLVYLVVMIGSYGALYLLATFGLIGPHLQNKLFCFGDASFKLLTACMLCVTNDVATNDELRRCALAKAADLDRVIQTASVPIFCVDLDSNVTEWNLKTAQRTGVSKEEAIGTSVLRMMGAESHQSFEAMLRRALEGDEQIGCIEARFGCEENVDDGQRNIEASKSMLMLSAAAAKDKLGRVQGVTFVGCDLTEVTAYKEADARKVRFISVVSHELRSPLNGIIGLIDYFTDGEQDAKKLRYINMVQNCATRLLGLVEHIMEMASMVSKKPKDPALQLSRDPVELNKIMNEIISLVKNSYDKSGTRALLRDTVKIFNNMEPLPIIEADAHKCTQVLYDIVTNACKFTLEGSITISSRIDLEGKWVEVIVSDTGAGIEAASLQRIFEPFEQKGSSIVADQQGIGLGLSMAHKVVQRHGGLVGVQSRVGVGTTCTVRLPVVMSDGSVVQNVVKTALPMEMKIAEPSKPCDKKLVLLSVDDDSINQEVVKHMLGDVYDIHVAMDGEEAIEYLQSAKELPELVLLDVMMPGISGLDVCKFVREELSISEIRMPILMLSASSLESTIAEAFNCGANAYMFKPFDKPSLTAQVHAALRTKRSRSRQRAEEGSTEYASRSSVT